METKEGATWGRFSLRSPRMVADCLVVHFHHNKRFPEHKPPAKKKNTCPVVIDFL